MSIESEDDLAGLKRIGRIVALALREMLCLSAKRALRRAIATARAGRRFNTLGPSFRPERPR